MIKINTKILTENKALFQNLMIWIIFIIPFFADAQQRPSDSRFQGCKNGIVVAPMLNLGVKIGPSLNQFSQPGTAIGMNIGMFGTYKVTKCFTARMELLFSTQGGGRRDYRRVDTDPNDPYGGKAVNVTNVNPQVTFNNIEIPILGEFGLAESSRLMIQPKLLLGGSYGFTMSAIEHKTQRYNFYDGTFADLAYTRQNVTEYYKRSQLSVIAGAGINFNMGNHVFSVDIRYRQGLTQLNQRLYDIPGMGGKLYSSSLIFNMGITL